MKANHLFTMCIAVLGLSLTACNREDAPANGLNESRTFAGMFVSTNAPASKAQADYAGRAGESKLTTLDLLSSATSQAWTLGTTADADGKFWETTAGSNVYKVKPWETTPGNQILALMFNKGTVTAKIATAANEVYGSADNAVTEIAAISADDAFLMTSDAANKTIAKNKKEADVTAGTTEADNVFSFKVERVVAQGLVAKDAALTAATKDGKGQVKLDDITYAAINGAVKTYLFRNHAGDRTLGTDGLYKNFASAIDGYVEFENAKDASSANVKANLVRLGNYKGDLGNYKAIAAAASADVAKSARGIYFLENSVKKDAFTTDNKNFGFYRMAYAKVYTVYTPNEVLDWETDHLVAKAGVEGETFYLGEQDGLIYKTKEAAKKSLTNPNQKAYTFTDGKCAYRALWNRQEDTDKAVVNADVRRNNTYLLTIKSFQGLGMPWDSSDPNDPNLPKPNDPDEPNNPDNPDIEKEATFMRVEATVLQWNLVSREVVLE